MNKQPVAQITKTNTKKPITRERCGCYNINSTDARCCGLCYWFCPTNIDKEKDPQRCDLCPADLSEYWYSGYVQTTAGHTLEEEEINGLCCCLCFPLKFSLFFSCFLGSLVNHTLNKCCATTCCASLGGCAAPIKRNYLC
jgi:hypothetical protein